MGIIEIQQRCASFIAQPPLAQHHNNQPLWMMDLLYSCISWVWQIDWTVSRCVLAVVATCSVILLNELVISLLIWKLLNRPANITKHGQQENMRALDVLWLYLDSPSNPTVINGLLFMEANVQLAQLHEHYERTLQTPHYRRFKQRPCIGNVTITGSSLWKALFNPTYG
jgi:hypothetical protein